MTIMTILYAILWFAGIALVLGAMLALASIVFEVKVDPKIPEITEVLPGANCGGCGFAGCSACAEAIVRGDAKVTACPVGGQAVADQIASIMGVEAGSVTRMRAQVMCSGTRDNARQKYIYEGPHDCAAAMRLGGGPKECPNGCIGFGTCELLCPQDAIHVENGVAVVRAEKCIGCGICVESCPKHIIKLIPFDAPVHVGCSSLDKGALTRTYCEVGCIGCKMCTKVCESGAITVNGAIASIDYEKCTHCGKCVEKCPRKIIVFEEGKAKIEESVIEEAKVEEPINEAPDAVTPTSEEPTPAVITEKVKTEEPDTPTAPDSAENQAEETTPDSQTAENP
ncbi:MAG: RnfABCDGE type electron transport complex subunit B [Clostridia bacterium]|nr:RnfABCDGE type electron transport complex subunit B [Clostridia bacterium]